MNSKKLRRKIPKITQKSERGAQNRRTTEGKLNNIGTKRLTLAPGFLFNGFSSNTVKKIKRQAVRQKVKESVLNEDLQAFLQHKNKNLRRSQRNYKNSNDEVSSNDYNNCEQTPHSPSGSHFQTNVSFKSILKKNTKSIFKDINERFAKTELIHKEMSTEPETFVSVEPNKNTNNLQNVRIDLQSQFINSNINESFCSILYQEICVSLKKKSIEESCARIRTIIDSTNLALQGKQQIPNLLNINNIQNDSSQDTTEQAFNHFHPFTHDSWLYFTPKNQKIYTSQVEESHLKPAVLCEEKNKRELYEFKANCHLKNNLDPSSDSNYRVPIDDKYLNRLAKIKGTPANFMTRVNREPVLPNGQNFFVQYSQRPITKKNDHGNQEFINVPEKNITFQEPSPIVIESFNKAEQNNNQNVNFEDFTFIEEGNHFQIQPSQIIKRKMSAEELHIKRRNIFTEHHTIGNNLFNFNLQEKNPFNFNNIKSYGN